MFLRKRPFGQHVISELFTLIERKLNSTRGGEENVFYIRTILRFNKKRSRGSKILRFLRILTSYPKYIAFTKEAVNVRIDRKALRYIRTVFCFTKKEAEIQKYCAIELLKSVVVVSFRCFITDIRSLRFLQQRRLILIPCS